MQVPLPVRGQSVNHLEGVPKCLTTKLGLLRSLAAFRCARSSHVVCAPDSNRVSMLGEKLSVMTLKAMPTLKRLSEADARMCCDTTYFHVCEPWTLHVRQPCTSPPPQPQNLQSSTIRR